MHSNSNSEEEELDHRVFDVELEFAGLSAPLRASRLPGRSTRAGSAIVQATAGLAHGKAKRKGWALPSTTQAGAQGVRLP